MRIAIVTSSFRLMTCVSQVKFNTLKPKSQDGKHNPLVKCKSKCKKAERNVAITLAQTTEKGKNVAISSARNVV